MQLSDIQAVFPSFIKSDDPAPVRDAIQQALLAMFQNYETKAQYAADQASPDASTGIYLKGFAQDHGIAITDSDSDDQIRAKIFSVPQLCTPNAILTALNVVLAPYTNKLPQLFEQHDTVFFTDGTGNYDSFMDTTSHYADRLYHDDVVENGGYERLQSDLGGSYFFSDQNGRMFVVTLPNLSAVDGDFQYVNADDPLFPPPSPQDPFEFFVADGSDTAGSETSGLLDAFVFESTTTADDLYNTCIAIIDRLKPQGYRYTVWVNL